MAASLREPEMPEQRNPTKGLHPQPRPGAQGSLGEPPAPLQLESKGQAHGQVLPGGKSTGSPWLPAQGYPLTVQGLGLQKASVGPHGVTQE